MSQVQWSSRIGHVLAAAGSAIGLGAIWKFPYVTATNGGGAFLLVFLLFSFTLGVAVLVGRPCSAAAASAACSAPSTSWWGRTGAGWVTWGSCVASSSTASTAWWGLDRRLCGPGRGRRAQPE